MDVEVGEVAVADRDEVAERTEVGLQIRHSFAVAGDGDGQFRRRAGNEVTVEVTSYPSTPVSFDGAGSAPGR